MAYEQSLTTVSLEAGSDLSTKQYYAVKITTLKLAVANGAGGMLGVLQNDPSASGAPGTVAISGITKWLAGGAVTAGSYIAVDTNGKCVNAVSGDIAEGIAMITGVDGDVVSVLLKPIGKIW